jgi:hypothetical protein
MSTPKLPPVGPVLAALEAGKNPKVDFARQCVACSPKSGDRHFPFRRVLRKVKGGLRAFKRPSHLDHPVSAKPILTGGVFA